MNDKSIGFIGGGRITRILLGGWQRADRLPQSIVVADQSAAALNSLTSQFPFVSATGDNERAARQDIVFAALHPPALPEVLTHLRAALRPEAVLVSLAPKVTLSKMTELVGGGFHRLARIIPNAPAFVNRGYNPMAFSAGLPSSDKEVLTQLFAPLGECPEVPEEKLEAYAVITAMGPTYFWFQWQILRDLARDFGLSLSETDVCLSQMLRGAAHALLESGLNAADVMDLVPVKPLADMEPEIVSMYRNRLPAVLAKIRP